MSETFSQRKPRTEPHASDVPALSVTHLRAENTQRRRILRRFLRNRLAVIGLIVLILIVLVAIFAPLIATNSPFSTNLRALGKAPSAEYLLGTDTAGRDVFARLVYGSRISLVVGIGSVAIYITFGTILGLVSGYYGGWIDALIMRIADTMMSLPTLLLVLMLVTITQPSLVNIILAIALSRWAGIARLVRGQVLTVKQNEYVLAAYTIGAPPVRVMFRHLLPNLLAPVIVAASFGVASAILSEAALGFLGLGVRPPTPTWGAMLNEAQSLSVLANMPWFWIPPGFMIAVSVLCINFVGDGIRDALDPRMKEV
ncbi:MAG: ABC transporter permease [Anaerolineae bacterium]|nr:ABC transporter permease [Anaerolineae bacterium]